MNNDAQKKDKTYGLQAPHEHCKNTETQNTHIPSKTKTKPGVGASHRNEHTPYGPYNLPHMVLCTKKT